MALLPARNILDGSSIPTTGTMKTAMGSLRDYLAGLLGTDSTDTAAARLALGAAERGSNSTITSLTAITNLNGGQLAGIRNKIRNGNFAVNQRVYVSGAAVGAGLYAHDRWKMAASADTYTFSTTANKTTVTIPAGKVLRQVVEGLNLQSGTYVLSWEGTAQGKIGAGSLSASGVTGTITGGVDTTIEFGPGTLANVQLEMGTVATAFEYHDYDDELRRCQRYFEVYPMIWAGASAANIYAHGQYAVAKRAVPTVTRIGNHPSSSLAAFSSTDPNMYSCIFNASSIIGAGGLYTLSAEL